LRAILAEAQTIVGDALGAPADAADAAGAEPAPADERAVEAWENEGDPN
jgi:hypothetical protein